MECPKCGVQMTKLSILKTGDPGKKCYDCGVSYSLITGTWCGYRAGFGIPGEKTVGTVHELIDTIIAVVSTAKRDKEYNIEINYTMTEVEPHEMSKVQPTDD